MKKHLPYISDELISYLEKIYPDKHPRKEKQPFEQGIEAGYHLLIDHLKQVKKWSEDEKTEDEE